MDWLIIKMFGVNRVNLVGWSLAGFFVISAGFLGILAGLLDMPGLPSQKILLVTICLLLLGIFGVTLQIYCSLLAEKLTNLQRVKATKLDEEE